MIEFRAMCDGDHAFIIRSWLMEYRQSGFARNIDSKTYFKYHHALIERLLKRAQVVVAHPTSSASTISGFVVYERDVIHYCYTKFASRNLGVARCLIEYAKLDLNKSYFTHEQRSPMWVYRKYPGLTYCPYEVM